MLAITLKEGDYFMIGDSIIVKYVSNVKTGYISMGIEAPRELRISRGSLYEKELETKVKQNEVPAAALEKARTLKGKYKKEKTTSP